jgi:hypothetical protein
MATFSNRDELRQLETRREQLIEQLSVLQKTNFANQLTLNRKQAELAAATDPEDRAAIQAQIANLNATIDSNQRRLAPLETQVAEIDQQVTSLTQQVFGNLPGLPSLPDISPATEALNKLKSVAVTGGVTVAGVLKQAAATVKIPGLDTSQITGIMGSIAKVTSQGANAVSSVGGIGKFGINPEQLEQQGFIKPGAISAFVKSAPVPEITALDFAEAERINSEGGNVTAESLAKNRQLEKILSSGSLWTGKGGVSNLANFTSNETLQSLTQQNVLSDSFGKLKELGTINGSETPEQLGSLLQTASKFGPETATDWVKGKAPADLVPDINNIAKDGQFAVNLVDTKIPDLGSLPFKVEGEVATVDRSKLDSAFNSLLGNPKIPLPSFGGQAAGSAASDLYKSVTDQALTFTGSDNLSWDRINAERLRRGLPSLADLGTPRPPGDITA